MQKITNQPDLCFTEAVVADVANGKWVTGVDVLVEGDLIVGLVPAGSISAKKIISLKGKYLLPAFIDAHIHIESSELTPTSLCSLLSLHGTGCIITDPHEIANVLGVKGLDYMIAEAKRCPIDVKIMLPSCVPATSFENSGATLSAQDLAPYFADPTVLGLAEVMNFPGVLHADSTVTDKIALAKQFNRPIDGHAPGVSGDDLKRYAAAGISSDHECSTPKEALERIECGMFVHLREGSAAKNLKQLLPAITQDNVRHFGFCCDDVNAAEIAAHGHLERHLRIVVSHGMDPMMAVQMASINTARHYKLSDIGSIEVGKRASFAVVDDIKDFHVQQTWISGKKVSANGVSCISPAECDVPEYVLSSVNVAPLSTQSFEIALSGCKARVIKILPREILTQNTTLDVEAENGIFRAKINPGLAQIAVVERHKALPNIGLGIVSGYLSEGSLMNGAIATTVAHDSHNIVILGDSGENMLAAVRALESIGGGMVLVKNGHVEALLPLEVAGLMSISRASDFIPKQTEFHRKAREIFDIAEGVDPVMTLSFLALPVIPELRVTDLGLFDAAEFHLTSVDAALP